MTSVTDKSYGTLLILKIFDFDKEVYASSGVYYIQYFYGFCMIFNIKN